MKAQDTVGPLAAAALCSKPGKRQTIQVCLQHTGNKPSKPLNDAAAVCDYMKDAGDADRESFYTMHMNSRNQVIGLEEVHRGTATDVGVHPREVFKAAILNNAASIVIAHNHPSGDPSPSADDRNLTRRLTEVGRAMGIPVMDHVIVGADKCYSFLAQGEMGDKGSRAGEPRRHNRARDVNGIMPGRLPSLGNKMVDWLVGGLLLGTIGGVLWWKWNQISGSGVPLNFALRRTFSRKFFEGRLDLEREYQKKQETQTDVPAKDDVLPTQALQALE